MSQTNDTCREAFEKWVMRNPLNPSSSAFDFQYLSLYLGDTGEYKSPHTYKEWSIWQAAWQARQPSIDQLLSALESLVYEGKGRWYAKRIMDIDVTDDVGAVIVRARGLADNKEWVT